MCSENNHDWVRERFKVVKHCTVYEVIDRQYPRSGPKMFSSKIEAYAYIDEVLAMEVARNGQ